MCVIPTPIFKVEMVGIICLMSTHKALSQLSPPGITSGAPCGAAAVQVMKLRHLNQLLEVFGHQIIHIDFKGEKEDFLIFN